MASMNCVCLSLQFFGSLVHHLFLFVILGSLPSIRSKLSSSGRTVTPLNVNMDEKPMELLPRPKKRRGFDKQFQQMLSQGKGVSVFEAITQERLKLGATGISFADEKLLTAKDSDGFTILHHAARCNIAEAVNSLLDNGVDVNRVENMGFTPLHIAVRYVTTVCSIRRKHVS